MGPGTVPQSGNSEWPRLFSIMFVSQDESPGESNSIPGSIQSNPPSRDRKYLPLVVWLPVEAAVLPPIKEFRRSGPMSGSKWRPARLMLIHYFRREDRFRTACQPQGGGP